MANITFVEASGVNDSIYGKSQLPIQMFIEKKAEEFERNSMIDKIFNMETSKNWAEKITSMTAMDGFKAVGENGAYPIDGMEESYSKSHEHTTWKNSFSISREMMDDAKLMDLKKKPSAFTTGYYRTRERFSAALLGKAMTKATSVDFAGRSFDITTADGKALFATDHPSILEGRKKQSNLFADAFSVDALSAVESSMQDFRGDNNEILTVTPDTIVIANDWELKKAVFSAIGADQDPDTASSNAFNWQFGRWNIIVWPYLNEFITAGTSPWLLLASDYNAENIGGVFYDRVNLEVTSKIADNDANQWKGYARFTAGFNDWRAFAIGGVAGGTTLVT